jgi:hypothetical protein
MGDMCTVTVHEDVMDEILDLLRMGLKYHDAWLREECPDRADEFAMELHETVEDFTTGIVRVDVLDWAAVHVTPLDYFFGRRRRRTGRPVKKKRVPMEAWDLRAPAPLTTEGGVVPLTKQKGE